MVGITLGIEGVLSSAVHPMVATKCLAVKYDERNDTSSLFSSQDLCSEELSQFRGDFCGYVTEEEWISDDISHIAHKDEFIEKMENRVKDDDLPYVMKVNPMLTR